MLNVRKLKLRWRIILGFLACALVTSVAVGIGFSSLRAISDDLRATRSTTNETITDERERMGRLVFARELVSEITVAQTDEEIQKISSKLEESMSGSKSGRELKDDAEDALWLAMADLLANRKAMMVAARQREEARRELATRQKTFNVYLEEIKKTAGILADNAQFDTVIAVDGLMAKMKDSVDDGGADNRIHLAVQQRLLIQQMLKEFLIFKSMRDNGQPADSAISLVRTTMDAFAASLAALRDGGNAPMDWLGEQETTYVTCLPAEGEVLTQLEVITNTWESFSEQIESLLASDDAPSSDSTETVLARSGTLVKEQDAIVKLIQATSEKDTRSTSAVVSQGAIESEQGLELMVAASGFKADCLELGVLVSGVLLTTDPVQNDYTRTLIEPALTSAGQQLAKLPESSERHAALEVLAQLGTSLANVIASQKSGQEAQQAFGKAENRFRQVRFGSTVSETVEDRHGTQVSIRQLMADVDQTSLGRLEQLERTTKDAMRNSLDQASKRKLLLLIVDAVSVGIALLIGVVVLRSVSRPIAAIASSLKDISEGEGDLTARLEVNGTDEIGELAQYFNRFVEKLQGIIGQIATNAKTLAGSSTELSATATQLASGAEETTTKSTSVAAAAEEMCAYLQSTAAGSMQMSANVKMVSSAVEDMTASISEVARNAEQAAQVAEQAAGLAQTSNNDIGQLGEAADAIGKVIETIQDIAEQTNLLALNATIEAARAGDAGKGFAVVANEVKELAKQTAEATEDIRHRIEGIQGSASSAVTSIGQIGEVINKVNDVSRSIASAVEEQSITTKEIAQNVSQTAAGSESISNGMEQLASSAQEITRNITGVDEATRQAAQGASQTQTASSEMSKLGEQLQSLVGQFKI